jgi:hypothetical protein
MPNYRQSGTSSPYTGHAPTKTTLTSERIAADIAAFNQAGGRIEVLGNTPFHHRSKEAETSAKANGEVVVPQRSAHQK